MKVRYIVCTAAVGCILILALLTGCQGEDHTALDHAVSQAISTHTPQRFEYLDAKGHTVTETVQPPRNTWRTSPRHSQYRTSVNHRIPISLTEPRLQLRYNSWQIVRV